MQDFFFHYKDDLIVGVARNKGSAFTLMAKIMDDCVRLTKGTDVAAYLLRRQKACGVKRRGAKADGRILADP